MKITGHIKIELDKEDSVTVKTTAGIEITIREKVIVVDTPETCQAYGYRIIPTSWKGNKLEEFLLQ